MCQILHWFPSFQGISPPPIHLDAVVGAERSNLTSALTLTPV